MGFSMGYKWTFPPLVISEDWKFQPAISPWTKWKWLHGSAFLTSFLPTWVTPLLSLPLSYPPSKQRNLPQQRRGGGGGGWAVGRGVWAFMKILTRGEPAALLPLPKPHQVQASRLLPPLLKTHQAQTQHRPESDFEGRWSNKQCQIEYLVKS